MEDYEETVHIFQIRSKITYIVTDNDANMKSAFSFPGFSYVFDNDDMFWFWRLIRRRDLDADNMDKKSDLYEDLPTEQNSCFAHTLQLLDSLFKLDWWKDEE